MSHFNPGLQERLKRNDELNNSTIQDRFEKFSGENPQVFEQIYRVASKLRIEYHNHCGKIPERLSISLVFEICRWENMLSQHSTIGSPDVGSAGFKLPNEFRSRYARQLNEGWYFKDMFKTRDLTTA